MQVAAIILGCGLIAVGILNASRGRQSLGLIAVASGVLLIVRIVQIRRR